MRLAPCCSSIGERCSQRDGSTQMTLSASPADLSLAATVEVVAAAVARASDSTPGPGGIPFDAWRSRADEVAPTIVSTMTGVMGDVMDLAPGISFSTAVFLPKAPKAEVAQFSCEVAASRPLTLTDALPKVMPVGRNDRLSALAARTVVGQQCGFIPGRWLAGKVYEAEAGLLSSSLRFRSVAAGFFDFKKAFPSVSRRWMMGVIS